MGHYQLLQLGRIYIYIYIYLISTSCQGILTVNSTSSSYLGMVMGFFQWNNGGSYASVTQLAWSSSGFANSTIPNTGSGPQNVFIQVSSGNPYLQVKTTANFNVNWSITFL